MRIAFKEAAPGLAALALVLATAAALSGGRVIYGAPTGDVPLAMPQRLGPWTGEAVWFCQNDQCSRSFPESGLEGGHDVCPVCGGELSLVSLGENKLLPAETPIFRAVYHRSGHPDLTATVVFSGMERRSIHRPQVCLVGQGNRILDEYTGWFRDSASDVSEEPHRVPLRVLQLVFPYKDPETGKTVGQSASVYAYWLFNPEFETVHHLSRFARMLFDNCFRAYRPRWGYASLAVAQDPADPDAWKSEIDEFLPHFRPVISEVRAKLAARRNVPLRLEGSSASANDYRGTNVTTTAFPRRKPKQ